MKLTTIIVCLLTLEFACHLQAAEPAPLAPTIITIDKAGHKAALTPDGWVGDRVWNEMSGFREGVCPVQAEKDGKWGAIDMTGNLIVPLEYDFVRFCGNGLIPVGKNKACGFLKPDGSVALALTDEWANVGYFKGEGLAPFQAKGPAGLWGYLKTDGTVAIPPAFEDAKPFPTGSGLARLKKGGKWGFINSAGKVIIAFQYENVGMFQEASGVAFAQLSPNGRWGMIDTNGVEIIPPTYWEVGEFSEGYADVKLNGKWFLIDSKGQPLDSVKGDEVFNPIRRKAVFRVNKNWGLANLDGVIVESPIWREISHERGCYTVVSPKTCFERPPYAVRHEDGHLSPFYPAPLVDAAPSCPAIRIEAGMHTAVVRSIATDRSGRLVLTASDDGTAKLWDREGKTAKVRHTLRPHSTHENWRCSLSPDGKIAVLHGGAGADIFDTKTGRCINRVSFVNSGSSVRFSPSGRWLAMGDKIYDALTGRYRGQLEADDAHAEIIGWLTEEYIVAQAFEHEGGVLLKYDVKALDLPPQTATLSVKPTNRAALPEGDCFALSNDGTRIAMLHKDSSATIFSGQDLKVIKEMDLIEDKKHGRIITINFLADGRFVCAGHWYKKFDQKWHCATRIWPASALNSGTKSKAQPIDVAVTDSSIYDLCPLPGGGLLYASSMPDWGAIEEASPNRWQVHACASSPIAQLNTKAMPRDIFRISPDGSTVAFDYGEGNQLAMFSVLNQKLTQIRSLSELPDTLQKPRTGSERLKITDWEDGAAKLDGEKLGPYSCSIAIAIDDRSFVLGTDHGLKAYNANGVELWSVLNGKNCWAVNLSKDGKIVVAAYDDGTIRWYDMKNQGREILCFFPHADRERWVLWAASYNNANWQPRLPGNYGSVGGRPLVSIIATTPEMEAQGIKEGDTLLEVNGVKIDEISAVRRSLEGVANDQALDVTYARGAVQQKAVLRVAQEFEHLEEFTRSASGAYFTCSQGAENLIGWHVDRGEDREADFYPCDQLYASFYRPDIVLEVMKQKRDAGAIAKDLGIAFDLQTALKKLPVVKLRGITDGETAGTDILPVEMVVQDTGGGVQDISLFHNGKRIPQDGPGIRRGELRTLTYTVTLQPGENEIKGQAANKEATTSKPALAKVNFKGVQATSTLHLLTIGLNRYQNPKYNLTYCAADADACAEAFARRAPGLFAAVKTYALRDADATKPKISETFAQIAKAAKPQDLFIFCYAGHGVMGEKVGGKPGDNGVFYFVTHDVTDMGGASSATMLAEKAVSQADIATWCTNIPARKQIMLLDTCQSGGIVATYAMRGAAEEKAIKMLSRATGTAIIASTGAEAYARESREIGHGIFTKAILDGITESHADANKDSQITFLELYSYLQLVVPELSQKYTNTPQYPQGHLNGQDFPIGIVK